MIVTAMLLLAALSTLAPGASARVGLADANVTVFTFMRVATSVEPPSASGSVSVNTQTGAVDVSLQGFIPGDRLQLLFVGLANIAVGPIAVDASGNALAVFTLPPGQYSGNFQLAGGTALQMITNQVTFVVVSGTTTSTSESTVQQGGGEPPGLASGWATTNVSVRSTVFTQTLVLNWGASVTLSSMSVSSSTNGQMIDNVAYNNDIVQVEFDHDGGTVLVVYASAPPAAIYADDRFLVEASSTTGLTFNSNAWVYDQGSGRLTVFADPSTVTFYGASPVPEFPTSLTALTMILAIVAAAATVNAVRRKQTRKHLG